MKIDPLIDAIQKAKRMAFENITTRAKTFHALDEAEKIAGWESAKLLYKTERTGNENL